jgi:hypothetical protein
MSMKVRKSGDKVDRSKLGPNEPSPKSWGVSPYLIEWLLDLQSHYQYDVALDVVRVVKAHYGEDPLDMAALIKYENKLVSYLSAQKAAMAGLTGSKGGSA